MTKKEKNPLLRFITSHLLIIFITLFLLLLNYLLIKPLVALPSPIYGGDLYYQLGQLSNFLEGGNPFKSATIPNSLPGYFILYTLFVGVISFIFGLNPIQGTFLTSYFVIILSVIIFYSLGLKLFKNKVYASLSVFLLLSVLSFPIAKYTDFGKYVMVPLFFLCLYNFYEKKDIKNSVFLGITYGLCALTHGIVFIGSSLLVFLFFLYESKKLIIDEKEPKRIKNLLLSFSIVMLVGFLISLIYWAKPIFIYHGQTSLYYNEWNNLNWASSKVMFDFFKDTLLKHLLNFSSIKTIILSLLSLVGIFSYFLLKNKNKETEFLFILLFFSSIITFHYFITQPLMKVNFIPNYIDSLFLSTTIILISVFGLKIILENKFKRYKNYIYFVLFILLLVSCMFDYQLKTKDKFYVSAQNSLPPHLLSLKDYLSENSNVNSIILTTKEIGFAVNSISGRKLVITRRAQNDPFLEMDSRELDVAIILYGNNTEKKKELIKKYNLSYLYWDYYWIQTEYYFDEKGKLVGSFDPLILFDSKEKREELIKYNISFFIQNEWVDPSMKGPQYKKFDLIFVSPENYYNETNPWKPDINPYLKEVWSYEYSGQKIARLFEINLN